MKIFFCFIVVVSTGALLSAINMKNPFIGIGVSAFAWLLFALVWSSRQKKINHKKLREELFLQYMRRHQSL